MALQIPDAEAIACALAATKAWMAAPSSPAYETAMSTRRDRKLNAPPPCAGAPSPGLPDTP